MAADPKRALRVAVCGSGNRSRTVWQRHLTELPGFELVGVQDISQDSLDRAVALGQVDPASTFLELEQMLEATKPDALLVCPVHSAHTTAVDAALTASCHVLVEKPFATELAAAVRSTQLARERNLQLGVVQNWRTKSVGQALRRAIVGGLIGDVSHIFFRYLRDRELPHLPEYLFEEEDPLLHAMAIHHFDLFRFALGREIVSVEGHSTRPRWSRYRHSTTLQLWLETDDGVAISYVATFSSRSAHLPQESLQVEGELGTLHNESAYCEPPLLLSRRGHPTSTDLTADVAVRDPEGQYELADRAILLNFRDAVVHDAPLVSTAAENLGTLAVVEAASRALREGGRVDVAQPASTLALR